MLLFNGAAECARDYPAGPYVFALFIATVALGGMTLGAIAMVNQAHKDALDAGAGEVSSPITPIMGGMCITLGVALMTVAVGFMLATRGL